MNSARRMPRMFVLALAMTSSAAFFYSAHGQPTPPAQSRKADDATQPARERAASGGEQAAEEEKDQTEQFKHSPSVLLVGRILGLDSQRSYWISEIINFTVIAGIIVWAARKYLPGMFRARTAAIQKAMQEAQKASEEARQKLAQIESRLQKLDVEIAMMRGAAEKEGAAEEARIQAAAREDARKIVASAEQEIAAAVKAARRLLTAHAGDLAVSLARDQIRVDAATDQGLVRNFAGQLGSASENPGSGKRKDGN